MASRRCWGAVTAAVLVASACGGKSKNETGPEAEPVDPQAELLRLLEPEAAAPPRTPDWVRGALFPAGYEQKQLVELHQKSSGNLGVVPAAAIVMSIEQDLAAKAECTAVCRRALFDAYLTLRRHEILGRELLISGISKAEMWSGAGPDKAVEIAAYTKDMVSKMHQRSRSLVAALVRAEPAAIATTRAMLDLASVEQSHQSFAIATALAAQAVASPSAPAADLLEAAEHCYRSGSLTCGDRSLVRARQAGGRDDIDAERWPSADRLKSQAHRAAELADKPEARRELAGLLVELQREAEAATLYGALMREYPNDAQMALGLARMQRTNTMRPDAAKTILAAGANNRDIAFYQVAAGVLAHHVFRLVGEGGHDEVVKLAPSIRSILNGFASHEPDRAEILTIGLDLVLELIADKADNPLTEWAHAKPLQRAIGRFVAAQKQRPKSVPLARLVLFLSVLEKDAARKKASVTSIAAAFASEPTLATLIRSARILLGDEGIAAVVNQLGEHASPTPEQKRLWIDLTASQTDLAASEKWTAVANLYSELLQSMGDSPDPRTVNNYGTALHHIGSVEEARKVWAYAIQIGADHPVPGINLYATGEQDREQLWQWIESKVSSKAGDTGRLARRWHIKVTVTDPKERAKKLAELDAEPRINVGTGGIDGAVIAIKYELGVGYSSSEDLLLNIELGVAPWLVLK